MRNKASLTLVASLVAGVLGQADRAGAQAVISDFNNFLEDSLVGSWDVFSIVSGPDSYTSTATGFGGAFKGLTDITGSGNNTIELEVNLSGPAGAENRLGPLVNLLDADGTEYAYRWFGRPLGSQTLTMGIESPSEEVEAGGTPGLDLDNLTQLFIGIDPSSFTSDAYTVEWENLQLIDTSPPSPLTVTDFNNFNLAGTYASWDTASITSGADAYTVESTGFGGGFAFVSLPDASANTHVELDVTVNDGENPNVLTLLQDSDGTQYLYRFGGLDVGNHLLTFPLNPIGQQIGSNDSFEGTPGSEPGLDLTSLTAIQLQVDPGESVLPYDISFNNWRLIDSPPSLPGDANGDGAVDLLDLDILGQEFDMSGPGLAADFNDDGTVDLLDLDILGQNFGAGSASALPEPTAAILLALGGGAFGAGRRRTM